MLFHHEKADGWITLAKKEKSGAWRQYHYEPDQLAEELPKWTGEDVYFSQNTFYKPQRRIENIRQLRALYVDADCYTLGYDPEWVAGKTDLEIFQGVLPEPNIIIYSGRGLVYVWLIEPVPYKALPLWQAVQNYFCEKLKYIGADSKATDATRIFRIDETVNSKNGKTVRTDCRHQHRYILRELQEEYLPDLTPKKEKKRGRKPKIIHIHNLRTLHYARLMDIVKLIKLRNGEVEGHRETLCFLYRYWSCCLTDDAADSIKQMLEFNGDFAVPLQKREVVRATKSAEKAWLAKGCPKANEEAVKKGYPAAGYNLKNTTIIKLLDITTQEQEHMSTLIDSGEKRRRRGERDKRRYQRRKEGKPCRNEYIKEEKKKTADIILLLKTTMERHPHMSNRKMAAQLGISESYVRKLKAVLTPKQVRTGCSPLY
ncbi:hypothetical protein SAMN05443094_1116 [Domibacillus enclensis]|uniref:Replication protein n=1 Tax=Domibacillus enclensis TaxID=1017273 RepID=A0A1N7C0V6_9BACI|nr:hypothetical protein SAMN05443094_1116 [Domibacillus enclensis]